LTYFKYGVVGLWQVAGAEYWKVFTYEIPGEIAAIRILANEFYHIPEVFLFDWRIVDKSGF
jgi:hypothetical protein